ncbi:hypothetical protein F5Y02DRAFT_421367 [Annulohypoxylon stygium]|nr:hypothetical protein F5Y02DRAFT_421367 [Annulohypoxylon stygium]
MSTKLELLDTNNKRSGKFSTSLEEYLNSPPTISEALAFSSATKNPMCKIAGKTQEKKQLLEQWQAEWDKTNEPKK